MADPLDKLRRKAKRPDFFRPDKLASIEARIEGLKAAGMVDGGEVAVKVSRALPAVADVTYEALEALVGQRVDFSLVVWSEGRLNYISTAERADVRVALGELLKAWDAGMPDVPAHEVQ